MSEAHCCAMKCHGAHRCDAPLVSIHQYLRSKFPTRSLRFLSLSPVFGRKGLRENRKILFSAFKYFIRKPSAARFPHSDLLTRFAKISHHFIVSTAGVARNGVRGVISDQKPARCLLKDPTSGTEAAPAPEFGATGGSRRQEHLALTVRLTCPLHSLRNVFQLKARIDRGLDGAGRNQRQNGPKGSLLVFW